MITDNAHQDEAVVAVIVAFMRDAERMAEVTATFLDHLGPSLKDDQSSWPAAFLLELGAVLRIREWEAAGIKDAIDVNLPSYQVAFTDLASRLQMEPERFIRGEAPLLLRVVRSWWIRCAQPNTPLLNIDMVSSRVERSHLISCIARMLWNVRDIDTNSTMERRDDE